VSDCQGTAVDLSKSQIRIRLKTGLQIRRIRICKKVTESVGFEIRHIPNDYASSVSVGALIAICMQSTAPMTLGKPFFCY